MDEKEIWGEMEKGKSRKQKDAGQKNGLSHFANRAIARDLGRHVYLLVGATA